MLLATTAAAVRAPLRVHAAADNNARWQQPARRPLGLGLAGTGLRRRCSLMTKEVRDWPSELTIGVLV